MIKAASVQFQHQAGNKPYNFKQIEKFCQQAAKQSVDIVCFPEMCITGYWHVNTLSQKEVTALSEPVPSGLYCQKLRALAREKNLIIGAGLIEIADDGSLYNTYVVCLPDGRIESHRKLHCFISQYMSSGDSYTIIKTSLGVNLGVLICYDNNIVENARITALKGANILLAPHQTGGTASKSPHAMSRIDPKLWEERNINKAAIEEAFKGSKGREWLLRWLPSRAHDNGMFILFSNGVGLDVDEVRTGNAMIIDCYGRIIAETWAAKDTMVVADLDLGLLPLCTGRRWLRARRPSLYTPISETTGNEFEAREARFSEKPT